MVYVLDVNDQPAEITTDDTEGTTRALATLGVLAWTA